MVHHHHSLYKELVGIADQVSPHNTKALEKWLVQWINTIALCHGKMIDDIYLFFDIGDIGNPIVETQSGQRKSTFKIVPDTRDPIGREINHLYLCLFDVDIPKTLLLKAMRNMNWYNTNVTQVKM